MESVYTALAIIIPTIGIVCFFRWMKKNPVEVPVQTTIHQHTDIIRDCIYSCKEYRQILICEDMISERIKPMMDDPHFKDCMKVLSQALFIQKANLAFGAQRKVVTDLAKSIHYFKVFS